MPKMSLIEGVEKNEMPVYVRHICYTDVHMYRVVMV